MRLSSKIGRSALLALAVLVGVAPAATAQQPVAEMPEVSGGTCAYEGIPLNLYRTVLNAQFTSLLGSAQTIPGSFGSVEIDKDQKAKLAASAQPGTGKVFSFEASGGVEDGVLSLIDNRASSTTFSAAIRLHLLAGARPGKAKQSWWSSTMLEYNNASCHEYRAALMRAQDSLDVRMAAIQVNAQEVQRQRTMAKYVTDTIRINQHIRETRPLVDIPNDPNLRANRLRLDSLRVDSARIATLLRIAENTRTPSQQDQADSADIKYGSDLRAAQELLKVTGFSMGWFTLSAGIQNRSFNRFDTTAVLASQIIADTYAAPRIALNYSRYTLSKISNSSRFWSVGIAASYEDNFSSLKKVELTDTKQYGPLPDERVAKKTVTAHKGAYEDNLGAIALTADVYQFLFRDNQGAIHFYPGVAYKEKLSPTYSAGVGFLWTVRKDKSAFFNSELFFTLTDINEAKPSDDDVWERSQLGLRLTFPILFAPR